MSSPVARAPGSTRLVGVLCLLLGAPVFAELIQSYLDITGELGGTLFLIAFLSPLYGGVALLIREVTVRTGRGWPGRLLLAAAFGVLMPTWVDLSMWTPQTAEEIELWGDIRGVTIAGVSVLALSSWALGHVLMSVGAPLVVVEALLPRGSGRPWLGWFGITVLSILAVGVAALIHFDEEGPDAETSLAKYVLSMALAAALAAAAFTPLGRPLTALPGRRTAGPPLLVIAGFVLMAAFDLAPTSWVGVVLVCVAPVVAGAILVRCARSPEWTARHLVAFAFGGILERTLIGFLVPTPPGGGAGGKLVQNVVVLLIVVALGLLLRARTREPVPEREVHPAQ